MSEDSTAQAGRLYFATKSLFEDLNRLGQDFGQALREENAGLLETEEYSYSPNELILKTDHTWLCSRTDENTDPKRVYFAAVLAWFEAPRGHWKVGPKERPEIWFFAGRVTPPPENRKSGLIRGFFADTDKPFFSPAPTLGGGISAYDWKGEVEEWKAVCIGFELGDVQSADDLKQKAVRPILQAAQERSIL